MTGEESVEALRLEVEVQRVRAEVASAAAERFQSLLAVERARVARVEALPDQWWKYVHCRRALREALVDPDVTS